MAFLEHPFPSGPGVLSMFSLSSVRVFFLSVCALFYRLAYLSIVCCRSGCVSKQAILKELCAYSQETVACSRVCVVLCLLLFVVVVVSCP